LNYVVVSLGSGKFRETFSSVESYDEGAAKKLWDKTAKMVKLGAGAKAKVDV
jgi:hypothetical protein